MLNGYPPEYAQGSGIPVESEPEDLAGLPQQRYSALHASRRKDSLPGFRHRKDTDERVQGGVQIQKELITQASPKRTRKDFDFSGGSAVDRLPILFVFLKNSLSE